MKFSTQIRIQLDPHIIGSPGSGPYIVKLLDRDPYISVHVEYADPQHCLKLQFFLIEGCAVNV